MSLFQTQVERQFLAGITTDLVPIYTKFVEYFGNPAIQANILEVTEEQYQGEFVRALFVDILGYTAQPHPNFNLIREKKNETDAKSADGAISINNQIVGVIELKDHKTQDLKKVEVQAFGYKNNHKNCHYVVTSNFERLRFYIDNAVEYIDFDLFNLSLDEFRRLWLCLSYESIAKNLPQEIKNQSISTEDVITKKLYKDYSVFKRQLFDSIVALNPDYDKLLLFKKTQKLLDRFLFLFFAEDKQLLPANSVVATIEKWKKFNADPMNDYQSLYSRFVKYFKLLDVGYKDANTEIYAYNGGLFAPDELLNQIKVDDAILSENVLKLAVYDYDTDVDVNILGHIFENSLNEIEQVANEITTGEKTTSKRKQDGVFYTPRYITQYIVENTVGRLCEEKKTELGIGEELFEYKRADKKKQALNIFDIYREWLLQISIVDPACGSGAFLNTALDFLIAEHKWIDNQQDKIAGSKGHYSMGLSNIENTILENNLFGVDINDESVEIAKLSLWLRTAKPHRKLSSLNNNIKCGNSLIDDPAVAGDKAFDWHKEFPQVFRRKNKKAWHITTATHNSRYSQRMYDHYVKLGEPVWLTSEDEEIITHTVEEIAEADQLNILAYNICGDHMHLALVCEEEELPKIVGKLKSMTARAANIAAGRTTPQTQGQAVTRGHAPVHSPSLHSDTRGHAPLERGETQTPLWTQKYFHREITSDEQLQNTIEYIRNNRRKHELPELEYTMKVCRIDKAFRTEYKGGFDVVIGNPPYGAKIDKNQIQYVSDKYSNWGISASLNDTYFIFYAMTLQNLLKQNGFLGFITPNTWKLIESAKLFRNTLLDTNYQAIQIIQHLNKVFTDATVDCDTMIIRKYYEKNDIHILFMNSSIVEKEHYVSQQTIAVQDYVNLFLSQNDYDLKYKINSKSELIKDTFIVKNGVKPYEKGKGKPAQTEQTMKEKPFTSEIKKDESFLPLIGGSYFNKYQILWNNNYWIQYGEWLAAPRDKEIFEAQEKLIFRQTSDSIIGSYITSGYIMRDNTHILLNNNDSNYSLKYALALLNSKLTDWFYWTNNPEKGEAMAQVKAFHLGLLPIIPLRQDKQQPFINKVDSMLSLNKELQESSQKFQRMLQRKFELEELPGKLQNWYLLSYKEFIAELGKKKVKLTLAQESEWEDYFNTEKVKALEIKKQIDDTDKEIDRMVYALYELTEEEVKIVEGEV